MSDTAEKKSGIGSLLKSNLRGYSMFFVLALIMLAFAYLTGGTNFSSRNFTNILIQYSYVMILAVGMVMVIIVLGIDLSVGSVCAFVGSISAMVYNTGIGMGPTLIIALAIGVLVGAFYGFWIAYMNVPAFIATLAGMLLFRGLSYIVTSLNPIQLRDNGYKQMASGFFPNIWMNEAETLDLLPIIVGVLVAVLFIIFDIITRRNRKKNNYEVSPIWAFVLKLIIISALIIALSQRFATYRGLPIVVAVLAITIFIFQFMMNNTILGRYIYAVGGNARSAKLSGINSELVVFIVFCLMGLLTGLAAVIHTGYMNSALPAAGTGFEMDAIASCYIGGVSAAGGIGTVGGVIVGALIMCAINNGMSLMNLGAAWQQVVRAIILLLAVFYDVYTRRKAGLG
ncbi:ABC transporter permease subunit [Leadbettera azotonutricia]|uniref:Xylose transport system permease protein XylH n=1 Tax=Leadbettera azotonutricia (strain ATCC BAA-888 / DSM 13862 / ZAS-9) TaxID=545695 RepID=F5YBE3_LEAAZ|nr:sugar ABC transporter permease [Leadbettera azotonutricia]AEF82683.1 ribose transport system permease protein RbsC [Leadbettera azotonutricia ZAS-9]